MTPGLRLALLASLLLCMGCMRYNEVELVGVREARLTRFDARGLAATITAEVHNPNNFRIKVMDPDMDLYVNGIAMGKAYLDSVITLEPNSTRAYSIPVRADIAQAGLLPLLMTSALNGSVKLGIKGTVVGKARALRKRFPFELEQQIDLHR